MIKANKTMVRLGTNTDLYLKSNMIKICNIKGEQLVKVLKMELDKDKPGSGFFGRFSEKFVEYACA